MDPKHSVIKGLPCIMISSACFLTTLLLCVIYNYRQTWKIEGSMVLEHIWVAAGQNQHNDMCAQRRLRSALASARSDQSLQCALSW